MQRKDVNIIAESGIGKSAAYSIAILENIDLKNPNP